MDEEQRRTRECEDKTSTLESIIARCCYDELIGNEETGAWPALHIAAYKRDYEKIMFLLNHLKPEDVIVSGGDFDQTALHIFCSIKNGDNIAETIAISEIIVEKMKGVLTSVDINGEFPLFYASCNGATIIAAHLISKMKNEDMLMRSPKKNLSALDVACSYSLTEIVEMYVARFGADVLVMADHRDDGISAAHRGFYHGDALLIACLLKHLKATDLERTGLDGRTALHLLCGNSMESLGGSCALLIARMNRKALAMRDTDGETALHIAAKNRSNGCYEVLYRSMDRFSRRIGDNAGNTAEAVASNTERVKMISKK